MAELARYNTAQCKLAHDECRSTRRFYLAGQNLALMIDTANEVIAQSRPETWFSEHVNADMVEIRNHQGIVGVNGYVLLLQILILIYILNTLSIFLHFRRSTGHFTQMVSDNAYKVGCSISKFTENGLRYALMACNYAVSNIRGVPIYEEGETASECASGINIYYPGLCSENEIYVASFFRSYFY